LLEESPSLRRRVPDLLRRAYRTSCDLVEVDLTSRGEMTSADAMQMRGEGFEPEQVLGEWWPEQDATAEA